MAGGSGASRLHPANRRPTPRSRSAGLLLQVFLGVLVGIRLAAGRPMSVAVTGAVLYGAIFVAVWWAAGRWFSVVLFLDVLPVAMAVIVDALGIDIGLGAISVLPIVGATLVGLLAARLDRGFRAPITGVEPATLSLRDTLAGELAAAGFHDRPDVACVRRPCAGDRRLRPPHGIGVRPGHRPAEGGPAGQRPGHPA